MARRQIGDLIIICNISFNHFKKQGAEKTDPESVSAGFHVESRKWIISGSGYFDKHGKPVGPPILSDNARSISSGRYLPSTKYQLAARKVLEENGLYEELMREALAEYIEKQMEKKAEEYDRELANIAGKHDNIVSFIADFLLGLGLGDKQDVIRLAEIAVTGAAILKGPFGWNEKHCVKKEQVAEVFRPCLDVNSLRQKLITAVEQHEKLSRRITEMGSLISVLEDKCVNIDDQFDAYYAAVDKALKEYKEETNEA